MTPSEAISPQTHDAATAFHLSTSADRDGNLVVELPFPRTQGGKPLMESLQLRRSVREYTDRQLERQLLSDLMWAACGINRGDGGRTVPTWRNLLVIDLYVAMADGVWLYEPLRHRLTRRQDTDLRSATGLQEFVATAPLNLIYVARADGIIDMSAQDRRLYASVDSAFMGQNVYLFCASEALATVFRGSIDYERLGRAMALPPGQFVTFAQTVGYPAL